MYVYQYARLFSILLSLVVVQGCGGGGGGAAAPDVQPGPPAANGNPTAPAPIQPTVQPNQYARAASVSATITNVTVASKPVLELSLVDQDGVALTGLTSANLRFTVAKLVPGSNGNSSYWQSYINRLKTPAVFPSNSPAVQATSEAGGSLVDHGDGTYTYTFLTDITAVTSPLLVTYEPALTHRVAIQFSGGPVANPVYDWVPMSGLTTGLFSKDVASTATCNTCHDPLALHGGGRQEMAYCVTCHNPGTSEPNSQTDMDMAVMTHKIHSGRNLPSVAAGGKYVVYGFRDSLHDYSHVNYPQSLSNCTTCHAGTATATAGSAAVTGDGDNWNEVPTMAACASCHDDIDFQTHFGGQDDNSGCLSCHSTTGMPGSVANSHRDRIQESSALFKFNILSVTDTAPGQFPKVKFSVTNPQNGNQPYNLATDPAWSGARLFAGVAFNTTDFTNTGSGTGLPNYALSNALVGTTDNGDGSYTLTTGTRIPDGTIRAPFRAASGSGMLTLEGRARVDVGSPGNPDVQNIPVTQVHQYFSISEPTGQAKARRNIVDIALCNDCHKVSVFHGQNRTDNIPACAACHNPRNTDKAVRAVAVNPPTDGKTESSLDFKVMIHALHASGYREAPYQVVGFRGFETHVYDEEEVQYPGRIANCSGCHTGTSWRLPLAAGVLATSIDTGASLSDPSDDRMITPASSACASCHDSALSRAHMEQNGGDFSATEVTISSGVSTETCSICHGPGRQSDVDSVHGLN